MKRILTLLFTVFTFTAFGQWTIPNNGLESWGMPLGTFEDPANWPSSNYLFVGGYTSSLSVFKSTDKFSGNYAARLVSVPITGNPLAGMIPDTVAIIVSGSIQPFPTLKLTGIPFTAQPGKLEFYAKYAPNGADTANIFVVLTKWNTTTTQQDTVGLGLVRIDQAVSAYTKFETSIIYLMPNTPPDTAMIMVASSGFNQPKENSELLVDQFAFTGGNVGYREIPMETFSASHFPNPTHGVLNISWNSEKPVTIRVTDITGKEIKRTNGTGRVSLDLSSSPSGLYFYQILLEGKTLYTGKFNLVK